MPPIRSGSLRRNPPARSRDAGERRTCADSPSGVTVEDDTFLGDDTCTFENRSRFVLRKQSPRLVVDEGPPVQQDRTRDVALVVLPVLACVDQHRVRVVRGVSDRVRTDQRRRVGTSQLVVGRLDSRRLARRFPFELPTGEVAVEEMEPGGVVAEQFCGDQKPRGEDAWWSSYATMSLSGETPAPRATVPSRPRRGASLRQRRRRTPRRVRLPGTNRRARSPHSGGGRGRRTPRRRARRRFGYPRPGSPPTPQRRNQSLSWRYRSVRLKTPIAVGRRWLQILLVLTGEQSEPSRTWYSMALIPSTAGTSSFGTSK